MSKLLAAFLALMFAAVTPALAQSPDEATVAKAIDALSKAIVTADKASLEMITWPELSYGHSAGKVENQKQFVDALVSKQTVIASIDNPKMSSAVVGDIAISRGTATYMVVSGAGAPVKTDLTLLLIWQKRGGEWKLLARQAFKV
jgi:ketosteroid isomerase-like protein